MLQLEDNYFKFKNLNGARIKKGFILVNKIFDELEYLKKSFKQYHQNVDSRRIIISEINIGDDEEIYKNENDIVYASPAVPQKRKIKRK